MTEIEPRSEYHLGLSGNIL